jgi:hypothetical protein
MQELVTAEDLLRKVGKDGGRQVIAWLLTLLDSQKTRLVNSTTIEVDQGKAQILDKMISDLRTIINDR